MILGALSTPSADPSAQDRTQARSMVVTRHGIVASEHPLASQAGAMILAQGGNAVDAAVAANAVMGLVGPMMNGIGGDLFAIVYESKSGKIHGLNASGWAPSGLTIEKLRALGHADMPQGGIHSVTVPGAVDGWDKLLARLGRLKLADVLAPAIRYAEEGFPVSEITAGYWRASAGLLRQDENAARTFLPGGRAPRLGEVFKNPDLAWSYRQIARQGRDAYYKGEIAGRLLEASRKLEGTLAPEDLAEFSSEWVETISTSYRGWTVHEIPPQGQGIAALMMLNLMELHPLGEYGHNSARALHVMIEAKKLAYADLMRYVADMKFSKVPVAGLLSKEYAKERGKLLDPGRAMDHAEPGKPPRAGDDTTYLSAVDRDGNICSLIQSNYMGFGTGIVPPGAGFSLQNRGALFELDPGHPNALAGRKRPFHTIIPAFMEKGDVRIAFGIMGGFNQAQAHAQFVSNVADHGLNIQAALEAARFTKPSFGGRDVRMESRVPEKSRADLEAMGHQIQLLGTYNGGVGGGQAVLRDFAAGVNYGASDPRKDGAAIPEPPPAK